MEPTTDRNKGPNSGRTFRNHASERLRILGEIPVRKFAGDKQPSDPDGNPDTSFLAKIPGDVAFTFQTLDKNGMVLNMAQTWHQVRPGEVRHDCGGCHAHSQKPTDFKLTLAAKPDYEIFDLTAQDAAAHDEGEGRIGQEVGREGRDRPALRGRRQERRVLPRREADSRAQLRRVPHASEPGAQPGGNLVLDDVKTVNLPDADDVPGTYYRLAMDYAGRFGHKPIIGSWRNQNASRYIRMFQSRRSLLVWKIFGERLDGWSERRLPDRDDAGRSEDAAAQGSAGAEHAREPQPRRPRLHRQRDAAAGSGEGRQGRAAHRRGQAHAGAVDRPRLPDRPRLRPEEPREDRLRLDARRSAADADAHARRRPARTRRSTAS